MKFAYKFLLAIALVPMLALSNAAAADRGTQPEAIAMVKKAVAFIKTNGAEKAYVEFANKAGISESRARQYPYRELPRYLRQFSTSDEGKGFALAKRIRNKIEQERSKATPPPAPAPEVPAPANP